MAIYGVIVSIILQTKMEKPDLSKSYGELTKYHNYDIASGYALFWAGVCCGFGNLACGSAAAPLAAPASRAMNSGERRWLAPLARARSHTARTPLAPLARAQGVRRHLR